MLYVVTEKRQVDYIGLELGFVNWGVEGRDRRGERPFCRGEGSAIGSLLKC
jgi:hypothetical protein